MRSLTAALAALAIASAGAALAAGAPGTRQHAAVGSDIARSGLEIRKTGSGGGAGAKVCPTGTTLCGNICLRRGQTCHRPWG